MTLTEFLLPIFVWLLNQLLPMESEAPGSQGMSVPDTLLTPTLQNTYQIISF